MRKDILLASIDLSKRRKRKAATSLAFDLIQRIRYAEKEYLDQIPFHLHESDAYNAAYYTVDALTSALVSLCDAFLTKNDEPICYRRPVLYELDDTY
jgi:hypothetical protein